MNNNNQFDLCSICGQSLDDGHVCPPGYDAAEIEQMLKDIKNKRRMRLLSDWERDFITRCSKTIANGIRLSQKQLNTLNPLWDRVTTNG